MDALRRAKAEGYQALIIEIDSEFIIKCIQKLRKKGAKKNWRVNDGRFEKVRPEVENLVKELESGIKVTWVGL